MEITAIKYISADGIEPAGRDRRVCAKGTLWELYDFRWLRRDVCQLFGFC